MRAERVIFLAGATTALTDIEHKPFMRKNIDPIIFPGKYVSHMHSFYGSDALTKDLPTTEELQKGCPSGENPNDLSVYCILNTPSHLSTSSFKVSKLTNLLRGTNPLLREWRQLH
jgi:hypothetical protein